jgi:hypothetical protein
VCRITAAAFTNFGPNCGTSLDSQICSEITKLCTKIAYVTTMLTIRVLRNLAAFQMNRKVRCVVQSSLRCLFNRVIKGDPQRIFKKLKCFPPASRIMSAAAPISVTSSPPPLQHTPLCTMTWHRYDWMTDFGKVPTRHYSKLSTTTVARMTRHECNKQRDFQPAKR